MAVVGRAQVLVVPSFSGFQRDVGREAAGAGKTFDAQMGKSSPGIGSRIASGIGNTLKKGVAAVGVAAGAGLGFALVKGFGRLQAIDQAQAKLTGLGHSTTAVKGIMDDALKSVKGTAFGLDEAATTAGAVVAAGIKPGKELQGVLTTVADTATIAGTSMADMGTIFGSVAARGKLQGDDMMQLTSKGVPVLQFLAKHYGITAKKASEMVSQGKVDFKNFAAAMKENIGGAAQDSGKTFTGALANLKASLGRIGAGLLGGAFPKFAPLLTRITKAMAPLEDAAAKLGTVLGKKFAGPADKIVGIIEKLSGMIAGGGGLKSALGDMAPALGPATGALIALGSAGFAPLLSMIPGMSGLGGVLGKLGGPIGILVAAIAGLVATSPELRTAFLSVLQQITSVFGGLLKQILPKIIPAFVQLAKALGGALAKVLPIVGQALILIAKALGGALLSILPTVASLITDLAQTVFPLLVDIITQLVPPLANLAVSLLPIAVKIIKALIPIVIAVVGAFAPLVKAILPILVGLIEVLTPILGGLAKVIGFVVTVAAKLVTTLLKWVSGSGIVRKALNGIKSAASAVAGFFTKNVLPIFKRFGDYLKKVFGPIVDTARQVLGKLFKGDFIGAGKTLISKGRDAISGLMTGAKQKATELATWLQTLPSKISGWIGDAKDWLTSKGSQAITGLINGITTAVPKIIEWFKSLPGKIAGWVGNAKDWLVAKGPDIIKGLVKGLKIGIPILIAVVAGIPLLILAAILGAAAVLIYAGATLVSQLAKGIGQAIGKKLKPVFTKLVTWVKTTFNKAWSTVTNVIVTPITNAYKKIIAAFTKIKNGFTAAKNWVSGTWKKGWDKAKGWISSAVDKGKDAVSKTLGKGGKLRTAFSNVKDWASTTWKKSWDGMKQIIHDPIGSGRKLISETVGKGGKLRQAFNAVDEWGKKTFGPNWDKMKGVLIKPINSVVTSFTRIFGRGGTIRTLFSNAMTAVGKIFDKIKGAISKPVKWVYDNVINKVLIGGINKIGGFVGLGGKNKQLIAPISTKALGAARGGIIPGHSTWRQGDDHLRPMRRGEGVSMSEVMRDKFERGRLLLMNRAARSGRKPAQVRAQLGEGFALGGLVGGSGRFSKLATATLQAAQKISGQQFSIFQRGYRPATSYSGTSHQGDAIDTGPITNRIVTALRAVGWAAWDRTGKGNWAPHIHAVPLPGAGLPAGSAIWQGLDYLRGGDGLGGRDNGPRGILSKIKGLGKGALSKIKDIGSKIGGAVSGLDIPSPATIISGAVTKAMKAFKNNSGFGQIITKIPGFLAGKAVEWAKKKIASVFPDLGAVSGGGINFTTGASGSAQKVIRSMMLKRWPESEWSALKTLVNNESSWNPKAVNASSGAYGLFQALPASKIDKYGPRTSIDAQGQFGLNYIADRYKTPSNALRQWQARSPHWYSRGTQSAARGLAIIAEHGPELVTTPQARFFRGGEQVKTAQQTSTALGRPQQLVGELKLINGKAYIEGIVEDVAKKAAVSY